MRDPVAPLNSPAKLSMSTLDAAQLPRATS